jgi:hypothetical protein
MGMEYRRDLPIPLYLPQRMDNLQVRLPGKVDMQMDGIIIRHGIRSNHIRDHHRTRDNSNMYRHSMHRLRHMGIHLMNGVHRLDSIHLVTSLHQDNRLPV